MLSPEYLPPIIDSETRFRLKEPVVIGIVGPWGSGKTTLLNDLIRNYALDPERVGVIFAEFGEVNVDRGRIAGGLIHEVPDRCICCHGADSLAEGIRALRPKVDLLLVETSGVANGGNIKEVFNVLGLRYSMLGLVNTAGFRADDTAVLDAQLPSVDKVLLTHNGWLGEPTPLDSEPRLAPLHNYLSTVEIDLAKVNFATTQRGLPADVYRSLVEVAVERGARSDQFTFSQVTNSSLPDSPLANPAGSIIATNIKKTKANQHSQSVITLLLNPGLSLDGLKEELGKLSKKVEGGIERGKGVVTDSNGIRREFDYVPARDQISGESVMELSLGEPSSSDLFGRRDHIVLLSRRSPPPFKYEELLQLGFPDLSTEKIDRSFSRYPNHLDYYKRWGQFPSYSKEGDRYYGLISPLFERLDEIRGEEQIEALTNSWRYTLKGYLTWRANGLKVIDELRSKVQPGESIPGELIESENLISLNLLWHRINLPNMLDPESIALLDSLKLGHRFFSTMLLLPHPPESGGSREMNSDYASMIDQFSSFSVDHESLDPQLINRAIAHAVAVDTTGTWQGFTEELKILNYDEAKV